MAKITSWIFDLDNTLYPATTGLFSQVEERIGLYVQRLLNLEKEEARSLQKRYFREHSTTLNGLIAHHGIDPHDFLQFVHDIDRSAIMPDQRLNRALENLEGRKFIFTNGSVNHASAIMERLGIAEHFTDIFDIVAANFVPKPARVSYEALLSRHGIAPQETIMIDDMARNLEPAAALGMTTLWIRTNVDWANPSSSTDHIHHVADDLCDWLESWPLAKQQKAVGV